MISSLGIRAGGHFKGFGSSYEDRRSSPSSAPPVSFFAAIFLIRRLCSASASWSCLRVDAISESLAFASWAQRSRIRSSSRRQDFADWLFTESVHRRRNFATTSFHSRCIGHRRNRQRASGTFQFFSKAEWTVSYNCGDERNTGKSHGAR